MRTARMKMRNAEAYYHLCNRIAGNPGEWPFKAEHKEKAFNLLAELAEYYLVEPISFTMMGNHFHLICWAPGSAPSPEQAAARHNAWHAAKKTGQYLHPANTELCEKVAKTMIDISEFMRAFQQRFSVWYNGVTQRRGCLWAGRFKSTLLEGECALWTCVQYAELNPVRAGMVEDAADYRWCTYGRFCGAGQHPFARNFFQHMRRALGEYAAEWPDEKLMGEFRSRMAKRLALERDPQIDEEELNDRAEEARRGDSMSLQLLRRVRHWTDGGIVGSKIFVLETTARFRSTEYVEKKRLSRGTLGDTTLYSLRRLRLVE